VSGVFGGRFWGQEWHVFAVGMEDVFFEPDAEGMEAFVGGVWVATPALLLEFGEFER